MNGNTTEARRARFTPERIAKMRAGRWKNRKTAEERFWAKVNKDGPNGCWLWTASVNEWGYGQFSVENHVAPRRGIKVFSLAHRYSWLLAHGPIPEGMVLDHLCRNTRCVNPDHLRVVTPQFNSRENNDNFCSRNRVKTHCPKGHPYTGDNVVYLKAKRRKTRHGTVMPGNYGRMCATCYPHIVNASARITREEYEAHMRAHKSGSLPEENNSHDRG